MYDRVRKHQHFVLGKKRRHHLKTMSKEYLLLFRAVADAEETLRQLRERLVFVQRQAEELYLQDDGEFEKERRIS